METLGTSETLIEGLVSSKQDEDGNLFGGTLPGVSKQSFDLGKVKCVESAVAESRCVDSYNVNGIDRADSSRRRDGPVKGISLFVELKGGVANKPDGESIRDVESCLLYENQVKVDVGQQESEVNVGDLVWAIIKKQKQSWWPGIVCDAANAPKEAANGPAREDDVLVRCFGNGNFVWCSLYDVKPFVGYFDRIPNQSQAKKFLIALEKAVTELGHRVKTEFSCSCSSNKMKMGKTGNVGDLSVARFEPAMFLDYIKDLGKDNSMPDKIDYVVKQNCLSAFYRSLGHLQIPLHQLKPANGTPLKIKTEEENGCFGDDTENSNETRERRKSKFLSYPGECGIDESNVDVNEVADLNKSSGQSQPAKKPRKKWTRKNKGIQENLCSSEVLSQLKFAAQDCLFPRESKNFDSVERFISGFRKRAFNDLSSEMSVDVLNHQILQETLPKKVRKKKDKSIISPALGNDFAGEIPVDVLNHQTLQETLPKKVRKDKSVISPALGNDLNHGSQYIDFQNVGSFNLEDESMANKRTEWSANQNTIFSFGYPLPTQPPPCKLEPIRRNNIAENVTSMHTWNADISTYPNVNYMQGLYQAPVFFANTFGPTPPYFTGNHVVPQVGLVPTGLTRVLKKRGRKRKNLDLQAHPGSTMDLQANPGSTMDLQANPGSTMDLQPSPGSTMNLQPSPGSTMNLQPSPGSTMNLQANPGSTINLQPRPGSTMNLQPSPGSTMNLQANPGSTMNLQPSPGSTMNLQANPGLTIIPNLDESVTGQKKQKRVKRSKEVGVPCIDLSYNKVQQDNLEVKGTAFLLKFSSDYPLPSNQDLNSVFSKFGALIESETQVSTENLSGQVVFLDSSSAGGAFWGLQNDKPFGPVLVNYKIQHLAGSESMVPFKTPIKSPSGPKPRDSKAITAPTMIPDLNTNSTEIQIIKRSKTLEEIRLPSNDNHLIYSKVYQGHEEVTGTVILLKFSPNYPLPSIQDLNLVFCKYGKLNEFETRVSVQDFTGQVVFVNPSTAGDAILKLEKERPFGPALLSYGVDHLYNVQSAVRVNKPVNASLELKPPQDLGVIKKNLEMMNLMLEKSGDSLSPEMRRKLESEIKGLMNKVNAVDGSSSSSCL